MADRSKIVIPVEPETPHFDAEETLLSARPVVPITHAESAPVFDGPTPEASTHSPFYRRSLFLPLLVIAAVGIGLAAGLGIARYSYVQRSASPVVAQPAQAPASTDTPATAAAQPPKQEEQAEAPALPEVKIEEKSTIDDDSAKEDEAKVVAPADSAKDEERSDERSKGDREKKEDNVRTSAPATREKKSGGDDAVEERETPRAQRRERRARERDDAVDIPRRVERASEQINRIREIFEGRQQRP